MTFHRLISEEEEDDDDTNEKRKKKHPKTGSHELMKLSINDLIFIFLSIFLL